MKLLRDPDARVRLVVCADPYEMSDVLLAVSDPIRLPVLETHAPGSRMHHRSHFTADARTSTICAYRGAAALGVLAARR
jgi:hypothetical protein